MSEKWILKVLIPAILQIDSGCAVCIGEFIDDANKQLLRGGSPFRYKYNRDENTFDDEVSVVEVNT